jgi:CRISPR system Cascade subunit CasD
MNNLPNTLFLRLEGPLQAWGDNSKFVMRRTMEAPTKSGVIGLICCAMGLSRQAARGHLPEMNELRMGVRIDRPGTRWWDYHTVGAGIGMLTAEGKVKTGAQGTLVTRREYLADASFLVALQGDEDQTALIAEIATALRGPKWPLFLGRKSCPPSAPVLAAPRPLDGETWDNPAKYDDLRAALRAIPWRPRMRDIDNEPHQGEAPGLIEWPPSVQASAPADAEVWYDSPVSFDPPVHEPRLVVRDTVVVPVGEPTQRHTPPPARPRANYQNSEYRKARDARLRADHGLCVFCKSPATTVQHITYRRGGGGESQDDLRSLCRLCHDAVTMIEYGQGMGLDRINPCEPRWREQIIAKRTEIIKFRSLETRRRHLDAEEVE